jgi:beta-glucosidase
VDGFPDGFLWGTSTSAYQIEGAVTEDGRGPSVWDAFCAEPGRVVDGSSGAVACDHYHRYREDVALARDLGTGAYRFSVAWPRIQPTGSGPVNSAGLDFYDRLVDELLAAGVAPVATLYHWDTPQPVEDAGGWLARDTAHRFADYAALVGAALGDRVRLWITLNEPAMLTMLGYGVGLLAPGRQLLLDALPTARHQLLGHGLAVAALRAGGVTGGIGITNNHTPVWPASAAVEDLAAADFYDTLHNRLFADPVLLGRWPAGLLGLPADPADEVPGELAGELEGWAADLPTISTPLDFYGVNYYQPTRVSAPTDAGTGILEGGGTELPAGLPFALSDMSGYPTTGYGWPVVPDGLRELLVGLRERYGDRLPPLYVTENGASFPDQPGPDGAVHDQPRVEYLAGHLAAVQAALAAGVDVRGYFVWSLLDNFEWAAGYTQRFGLVHVDYGTQRRTPKDSYHWLRGQLST